MYKAGKDQISVFGLKTQFGGGKTTGFALIYDSPEAMKKFEPMYRLVRVGMATKPERASRQQRTCFPTDITRYAGRQTYGLGCRLAGLAEGRILTEVWAYRQATQEPTKDTPRYGKGQGREEQEGEISDSSPCFVGFTEGNTGSAVVWEDGYGLLCITQLRLGINSRRNRGRDLLHPSENRNGARIRTRYIAFQFHGVQDHPWLLVPRYPRA